MRLYILNALQFDGRLVEQGFYESTETFLFQQF